MAFWLSRSVSTVASMRYSCFFLTYSIESTFTPTEWGTSSRNDRRTFSRTSSATIDSSVWSDSMSAGNHLGPSGSRKTHSSTKASTLRPVFAESSTMASHSPRRSADARCASTCSGVARSALDSTQMRLALHFATCAATHSSPRPIGWVQSTNIATTSTSSSALVAEALSSSPSTSLGLCSPGVSTRTSW